MKIQQRIPSVLGLAMIFIFVGCETEVSPPSGGPGTAITIDPGPGEPACHGYICCCWDVRYHVNGEFAGLCEICNPTTPLRIPYSVEPGDTVEIFVCGYPDWSIQFCILSPPFMCFRGSFQVTEDNEYVDISTLNLEPVE